MNENIDLTKILKNCPKGWKFWSPIFGEVEFERNYENKDFFNVSLVEDGTEWSFVYDATIFLGNVKSSEIMLYPSKEQRDWNKFTAPWYKKDKFDPSTLQPFDKVLVRDGDDEYWRCGSFSCMLGNIVLCEIRWNQGIPYNDETKYLVGTNDIPDEKYIWWNEN